MSKLRLEYKNQNRYWYHLRDMSQFQRI